MKLTKRGKVTAVIVACSHFIAVHATDIWHHFVIVQLGYTMSHAVHWIIAVFSP